MAKPKPIDTTKITKRILAPVAELAKRPGMRQRIADEMSARTGQSFTRQMIERWLLKDEPVEPKIGNVILLLNVGHELSPDTVQTTVELKA